MFLASGLVAATVIDLRTRRIPNALTGSMAGIGIALAATHTTGISPAASVLGFGLGMLLMLPGHALGATGAGDVKLMAAVGAFVGPPLVVTAFVATAITGGVLALIVALRRGRLGTTVAGTARLVASRGEERSRIQSAGTANRFAYGPAIAIGSLLAVLGQFRG